MENPQIPGDAAQIEAGPPRQDGVEDRFGPPDPSRAWDLPQNPRFARILRHRRFQFPLTLPNQIISWTVIFAGLLGTGCARSQFRHGDYLVHLVLPGLRTDGSDRPGLVRHERQERGMTVVAEGAFGPGAHNMAGKAERFAAELRAAAWPSMMTS